LRLVTNLLHSYDAAGNNLIVVVGADERENGWIGEALAEHAAVSMAIMARGLSQVNTDMMSVGTRSARKSPFLGKPEADTDQGEDVRSGGHFQYHIPDPRC